MVKRAEAATDRMKSALRALMVLQDTNPTRLALDAGLNRTAIHDFLASRSANPRRDTIEKIAAALGVTAEGLMRGDISLSDEERLVSLFRRLPQTERVRFLRYMEVALLDAETAGPDDQSAD